MFLLSHLPLHQNPWQGRELFSVNRPPGPGPRRPDAPTTTAPFPPPPPPLVTHARNEPALPLAHPPRQEDSGPSVPPPGPRIVAQASQQEPVIMGSAAPATVPQPDADPVSDRRDVASYVSADAVTAAVQASQPPEQPQPLLATHTPENEIEKLRASVLQALADGNQNFLASLLSGGEKVLIAEIGRSHV